MSNSVRLFLKSILFSAAITLLSYLVGMGMGWITSINWLEVLAVFTSYSCTYLCVHQSRWNYPIGVVTTFLYSWFYWAQPEPAVALAVFNLYLVGSLCFGYFRWGPDGDTRPVSHVEGNWWFAYLGATLAVFAMISVAVYYGAVISKEEIAIVVISALAQFLLDNKKIETWAFWIVVNIISIHFYWSQGWYLVMFQYLFFLGNAFWGWYEWLKSKFEHTSLSRKTLMV